MAIRNMARHSCECASVPPDPTPWFAGLPRAGNILVICPFIELLLGPSADIEVSTALASRGDFRRRTNQWPPLTTVSLPSDGPSSVLRGGSRRGSSEPARVHHAHRWRGGSLAKRHSHKPSLATVFDYSCALAQGDWCPGPALTCGQVRCLRDLKVLDACQVFCDVLALGVPHVDAVSEMGAIVYRHFPLPLPLRPPASRPGKPGFSSEPIRRSARQGH